MIEPDQVELVFDAVVAMGRNKANVKVDGLAAHEELSGLDRADLDGAVAELVAAGRVEVWVREGKPVVILTPLSAERLGLKLLPSSSRWVSRTTRDRSIKLDSIELGPAVESVADTGETTVRSVKALVETDMDDETDTPLDQRADPNALEATDVAAAYDEIAERRRRLVKSGKLSEVNRIDKLKPPSIVMMGSLPYPHPGQDRGPFAPRAIPEPEDVRKDWKLRREATTCHACKDLPLPKDAICEVCLKPRNIPKHVREEVEAVERAEAAEREARERRKPETADEPEPTTGEIAARPGVARVDRRRTSQPPQEPKPVAPVAL